MWLTEDRSEEDGPLRAIGMGNKEKEVRLDALPGECS
jgi:hypothetical protein